MSENPVDTPALPAENTTTARTFTYLMALTLFAVWFNLGGRPIETKDYLRYAEVAREILESGDWVMMHLNGDIYVDKPPLHFWLIAGSYKIFGVNPFAARLPSSLGAIGFVLLTFFFVQRRFGSTRLAFMAAVMLLSAYDFLWWARRTRLDMMFAFLFSASLVCFYCGSEEAVRKRKALWYLAFWFVTGLAFMDKAFIAFANLLVVIPYSIMAARNPQGRRISPGLFAATSPCLLPVVLPWIFALTSHPQFSTYWEILGQTKIMDRREAFYFYLVQMPLKLLPATPFFALGIWIFFRRRKEIFHRRELGFVLWWFASFLFILHLTVAKNTRYLLPLYLPVALVGAWTIEFFLENRQQWFAPLLRRIDRAFFFGAVLSLGGPLAFAFYWDVSPGAALLYSAALGAVLFLARRFLPYRSAGLFVSVIILLVVIDVCDTVGREQASIYYRINHLLQMEKLKPEQIALYKCSNRLQEAMSFYFNRIASCSENWAALESLPRVRAVVTTREALAAQTSTQDLHKDGRIISLDKGWVIYIKPE
jgi:4-amino-4-deoxy-L-arabinose transferase-like glycosyltransferase